MATPERIQRLLPRSALDELSGAPRAAILLPVAFLLHVAEEWFGGFLGWTAIALGYEISPERFALINGIGFMLFGISTLAALRNRHMAWFAVSLAALLGLNGVLHALATVGLGSYSPGAITGLLLYIPLSVIILRSSAERLSRAIFTSSVLSGVTTWPCYVLRSHLSDRSWLRTVK